MHNGVISASIDYMELPNDICNLLTTEKCKCTINDTDENIIENLQKGYSHEIDFTYSISNDHDDEFSLIINNPENKSQNCHPLELSTNNSLGIINFVVNMASPDNMDNVFFDTVEDLMNFLKKYKEFTEYLMNSAVEFKKYIAKDNDDN